MAKTSGSSTSKGNPAHKRIGNEKRKLTRARSHARLRVRKLANAAAQRAREAVNRQRRASGEPTPWEAEQAARDERRRPVQEAYAKRHKEDILTAS